MILRRVTVGVSALSLADAKAHLRVDHDDEDDLITALAESACASIAENVGRVLIEEQWTVAVAAVDGDFVLPLAPVRSVDAITYFDADDTEQAASVDDFYLFADDDCAILRPKAGKSWPATIAREDAITITITVGMTAVPPGLIAAAKLLLGHWYDTRAAVAMGQTPQEVPLGVQYLCDQARRNWVAA